MPGLCHTENSVESIRESSKGEPWILVAGEKHSIVTSDSWNSFGAITYFYELKKRGDSNNKKDGNDRRWTH